MRGGGGRGRETERVRELQWDSWKEPSYWLPRVPVLGTESLGCQLSPPPGKAKQAGRGSRQGRGERSEASGVPDKAAGTPGGHIGHARGIWLC